VHARVRAAAGLARLAGAASRLTGRGGGTTLPGHVLLRLAPDAPSVLAERLPDGVALLSATNGKTTTCTLLAGLLEPDRRVCRNASGANLMTGVAATLAAAPSGARVGVLEVDEAALPGVVGAVRPRVIALGNLSRDQLDRHGELDMIADRWRAMVADLGPATTLVLGADDPVVDALGADRAGVLRYGLDDPAVALPHRDEAADSRACVRCGAPYAYDQVYLGHLGAYRCPRGDHDRGVLDLAARDIRLDGTRGTTFRLDAPDGTSEVRLALPGLYNVENALAAIAVAYALGVPTATAAARMAGLDAAFGRFERIPIDGREAILLLIKNPTAGNEALRAIRADAEGEQVVLALNDRIADGRDTSWIWDVDVEGAFELATGVTCAGTRAEDLAVRLRYAGIAPERFDVVRNPTAALDRAIAASPPGGRVILLATYTAMLELHRDLARRGLTRAFWEERR
jgi:UDP-N-acetylmuramyl tripeptide synthase